MHGCCHCKTHVLDYWTGPSRLDVAGSGLEVARAKVAAARGSFAIFCDDYCARATGFDGRRSADGATGGKENRGLFLCSCFSSSVISHHPPKDIDAFVLFSIFWTVQVVAALALVFFAVFTLEKAVERDYEIDGDHSLFGPFVFVPW